MRNRRPMTAPRVSGKGREMESSPVCPYRIVDVEVLGQRVATAISDARRASIFDGGSGRHGEGLNRRSSRYNPTLFPEPIRLTYDGRESCSEGRSEVTADGDPAE